MTAVRAFGKLELAYPHDRFHMSACQSLRYPPASSRKFGAMLENTRLQEKYALDKMVGNGSFSVVYRATERSCGRTVAIKALRREVYDSTSHEYADSEVCAMGRLWAHENIVSVHTVEPGDDDYVAFIVMEHVDGGSLRRQLHARTLSLSDALAYTYDICNALAYAHGKKVLHRDVKPRNVLLTSTKIAKVSDFGVAQVRDVLHDYASTFAGTRRYMAPEQYVQEKYDHRVDVYAAAILLWEMATGEYPFPGASQDEIQRAKQTPPDPPSWLSPAVQDILRVGLRADPFSRFRDMGEMCDAVQQTLIESYERVIVDRSTDGTPDELTDDALDPLRQALRLPKVAANCVERCVFQDQERETRRQDAESAERLAAELSRAVLQHVRHDNTREAANAIKQMQEAEVAPRPVLDLVHALWRQANGPSYTPLIPLPPARATDLAARDDDDTILDGDAPDDEQTALRLKAQGRKHELDNKQRRARTLYRRSARVYEHKAQAEKHAGGMTKAARLFQNAGESFGLGADTRRSHASYGEAATCWLVQAKRFRESEKWEHAAEAHRFAARAYDQAGRKEEAETEYLAAAGLLYKRARNAYERHAYADAELLCRQAVELAAGSTRWRLADEVRRLLHAVREAWS